MDASLIDGANVLNRLHLEDIGWWQIVAKQSTLRK
ncbi:Uncharacterised protein [Pseudomonas aeruginosa]|nr:Uncharacterised protein [Pseudomonas aeruginosa]